MIPCTNLWTLRKSSGPRKTGRMTNMQQTGNYDCPVCHNFRGDRIGQHLYAHKKKGAFTGKIDWTCKSYLRNGAVVPTSDTRKVSLKKKVVKRPLIER